MEERITITSKDWYNMFARSGENNFPVLGKGKRKKLSFMQWRTILITFFEIYFYEVFFIKKYHYFFLTGLMTIVQIKPKLKTNKGKKVFMPEVGVGICWFKRPIIELHRRVKVKMLKGSSHRFPKLIARYKEKHDPYNLETSYEFKERMVKNKLYYQ